MEKVINSYETLFIADVSAGEEAAKATAAKFIDIIGKNAEIVEVADWGKRRLAYLVNDKPEGYYTVVTFKAEPSFPTELERLFNIDETVMRSMVVKLEYEAVAKAAAPAPEEVSAEEAPVAAEAPATEEAPAAAEVPAAE
ncbi:MAG: 30S ribosomal protein S6 [Clostridia bacterium]|nr:30S ribosomal protein S6 [Clostridia bacterium]MDD7700624.1 30S ribosomal protein S6 [Eubacteriales bacterium]MDY2826383.1 30S ribosomal protein S6 [Eubacteriales bacterium]